MAESSILAVISKYLKALPHYGIHPSRAVLFGSFATERSYRWSDIDIVVVASEFDRGRPFALVKELWLATAEADDRIEPIPCGEREWEGESDRPIIEVARRDGIIIPA